MRFLRVLSAALGLILHVACGGADLDRAAVPEPPHVPYGLRWQWHGADLTDCFFIDDQYGWAVGEAGIVLATQDGGKNWRAQVSGVDSFLQSVFFVNRRDGWAVGTGGYVLRTSDGGERWAAVGVDERMHFSTVRFSADKKLGWALARRADAGASVLFTGHLFRSVDGGKSWNASAELTGTAGSLAPQVMALVDAQHGTVAGCAPFHRLLDGQLQPDTQSRTCSLYRTADAGATWRLTLEFPMPSWPSMALHFVDARVGWLAATGRIWRTADGGETWQLQKQLVSRHSIGFFSSGAMHVWFVGSENNRQVVWRTRDSGKTWLRLAVSPLIHMVAMSFQRDGVHGVAVGPEGLIFETADGGGSWRSVRGDLLPINSQLISAGFADEKTGWLVGKMGAVLRTENGGVSWRLQPTPTDKTLRRISVVDPQTAWAVGDDGVLLATRDAGRHWQIRTIEPNLLPHAVHFIDHYNGWVVGLRHDGARFRLGDAVIFRTSDGGQNWHPEVIDESVLGFFDLAVSRDGQHGWAVGAGGAAYAMSRNGVWTRQETGTKVDLASVFFLDERRGWAASGEENADPFLMATSDGGQSWTSLPVGGGVRSPLHDVAFVDEHTGWLLSEKQIAATTDGGATWTVQALARPGANRVASLPAGRPTYSYAMNIAILPDKRVLVVREGMPIEGTPVGDAPIVSHFLTDDSPTGTQLRWRIDHPRAAAVECIAVDFRRDARAALTRIEAKPRKEKGTDRCALTWDPATPHQIRPGAELFYRVTLKDDTGLTFAHAIDEPYLYKSWWSRRGTAERWALLGLLLVAAYLACCLLLLWLWPGGFVWLTAHAASLDSGAKTIPEPLIMPLALLVHATLLPVFGRHPRTRQAWVSRLRDGRARFADLPGSVRDAYLAEPACLDAWVDRRRSRAAAALDALPQFRERSVYIPLPVRDAERGMTIERPDAATLRDYFTQGERSIVAVVGPGGAGKSTLACQMARWALAASADGRLAPHVMLPIFLDGAFTDLRAHLFSTLRIVFGDDDTADDVLLALLRRRRVLVIVDAFSERPPAVQQQIEQAFGANVPMQALLVTTRRAPGFGPVSSAILQPEAIAREKIVYFLIQYLEQADADGLFLQKDPLTLAARLVDIIEHGATRLVVTPLLIRLLVDEAVALARAERRLDFGPLSDTVPRLMLEYVRRTNPQDPAAPGHVANERLVFAARLVGEVSLCGTYVPGDFFRAQAIEALRADAGLETARGGDADALVDRLVANGILQVRDAGGSPILRFLLDPLAEYLAAMLLLDRLAGAASRWAGWLDELRERPTYPAALRGFLVALDDCVRAFGDDFAVPPQVRAQLIGLAEGAPARRPDDARRAAVATQGPAEAEAAAIRPIVRSVDRVSG